MAFSFYYSVMNMEKVRVCFFHSIGNSPAQVKDIKNSIEKCTRFKFRLDVVQTYDLWKKDNAYFQSVIKILNETAPPINCYVIASYDFPTCIAFPAFGDFLVSELQKGKGVVLCKNCSNIDADLGVNGKLVQELPIEKEEYIFNKGSYYSMIPLKKTHFLIKDVDFDEFNGGNFCPRDQIRVKKSADSSSSTSAPNSPQMIETPKSKSPSTTPTLLKTPSSSSLGLNNLRTSLKSTPSPQQNSKFLSVSPQLTPHSSPHSLTKSHSTSMLLDVSQVSPNGVTTPAKQQSTSNLLSAGSQTPTSASGTNDCIIDHVANWKDDLGTPLIVGKSYCGKRIDWGRIVVLNLYPMSSMSNADFGWVSEGDLLLQNAVLWSVKKDLIIAQQNEEDKKKSN